MRKYRLPDSRQDGISPNVRFEVRHEHLCGEREPVRSRRWAQVVICGTVCPLSLWERVRVRGIKP